MSSRISDFGPNNWFRNSFRKWPWMKVLVVTLLLISSVCLVWTSARTADTKRQSGGFTRLSGSESQPAQYVPGELIVKFRDAASAATIEAAHSAAGGRTIKTFLPGQSRLHHLKLNPGVVVEDAVSQYQQSPAVEYAEPNYLYQVAMIPNDTKFTSLWGLHNTGQTVNGTVGTIGVDIDAPQAWDLTTGNPNVIIGVVDTGIAYDHPDLAQNMWINSGEIPNDGIDNDANGFIDDVNGYDFVNGDSDPMDAPFSPGGNPGHGTHVAGTIAAAGDNGLGITGVMHTAKLMALKAGDVNGSFPLTAILQAEDYARLKGARAINASFGRSSGPCSQSEYAMLSALNTAGIMFLVAAGNDSVNSDATPSYPAQYSVATTCGPGLPNVIAVAAVDQNGERASFSNFGATSVQIAAPGVNINSTKPTSNFTRSFFHDYDSHPGALGYTFTGTNNSWGFTNNVSLSPPTSLTDSPAGKYLNNTDSFSTGPMFSTLGLRGCRLIGSIRLATELNFDGFLLDISRDGGATWTTVSGVTGTTHGTFVKIPFSDIPDRSANNRFRFNFISDSSNVDDGGYFDNVGVACTAGAPSGTTDYQFLKGTSMATPHVTGVVGLVLAANPNLNVAQIRDAILNTGLPDPALNGVVSTGSRLNARNAVVSVVNNFTVTVTKAGTGTGAVTSSPSGIHCGATCSRAFPSPGSVTLSATPTGESIFDGWTGGVCAGTGTCVVSTNATLTATFSTAPAALAQADGGGGGCTLAQSGKNDALMPILLLVTLGVLIWKVRRRSK
jgi:subtilisin family serine protease